MKIKLSFLKSSLHDKKNLDTSNHDFLEGIEKQLNQELEVSEINDYDCDLKLIFIESGGSEGLFLEHIEELKEPYYLLTSGNNNSLAASLEILTYLNLHEKKGEILHGTAEYVSSRIKDIIAINKVKEYLTKVNLGLIGEPSSWLISSIPSFDKLHKKLGVNLTSIDIQKLIKYYNEAKEEDFTSTYKLEFDNEALSKAKRMSAAISRLKDEYKLDGLTIRCFDLLSTCNTTSCLGLALLNSNDLIGTCEGDVMAMISMTILHKLLDEPTFQANPSKIDVDTNQITFAHCTIPFTMLKEYKLDTHFESGIGVAIKGELKEEDVTIFRMSSDLKHYFVSEGKIITNLNKRNLCRTQIVIQTDDKIKELLTHPCGNHHIIVYGKHQALINKLMKELDFKEY